MIHMLYVVMIYISLTSEVNPSAIKSFDKKGVGVRLVFGWGNSTRASRVGH